MRYYMLIMPKQNNIPNNEKEIKTLHKKILFLEERLASQDNTIQDLESRFKLLSKLLKQVYIKQS